MFNIDIIGLQPSFIIVPIIFFVSLILMVVFGFFWWRAWNEDSYSGWTVTSGLISLFSAFTFVILGLVWFFSALPFNDKYYQMYSISGTIESVSNGIAEGDGDITYRSFIVQFEGEGTPYKVTDPRISALDDQEVELLCVVSWVNYGYSADQWECDIRSADYTKE